MLSSHWRKVGGYFVPVIGKDISPNLKVGPGMEEERIVSIMSIVSGSGAPETDLNF